MVGRRVAGKSTPSWIRLELIDQHRRPGDALERGTPDEIERSGRLNNPHRVPGLYRKPSNLNGLIGRNPASYAKKNPRHKLSLTPKRTNSCNRAVAPLTYDL